MLKIVGSLLILCCSAGLGAAGAGDLKKHCMELRLLKQALYMLRGEIKYSRAPLPEAFGALADRLPSPFGEFFSGMREELGRRDGRGLSRIWKEEMSRSLKKSSLRREEKEKLGRLGEGLGYLDLEMQLSTMELYLEQLEGDIQRAEEEIQSKQRLYRSLGVAGGIFLVILLI
ncbi:MAG: hypothetical protein HFI31_03680 [Lachnospiraceae bacterium]|jgi:stage III sporulation protein AB|nr:hypothetical protein [Lachnospiraceae bacterium]MCI8994650.1 hypothetical protein [Lachnospiraceae bacterium]MCI9133281.1 hypothetical protein [Lachnospiraceae bacterium]